MTDNIFALQATLRRIIAVSKKCTSQDVSCLLLFYHKVFCFARYQIDKILYKFYCLFMHIAQAQLLTLFRKLLLLVFGSFQRTLYNCVGDIYAERYFSAKKFLL